MPRHPEDLEPRPTTPLSTTGLTRDDTLQSGDVSGDQWSALSEGPVAPAVGAWQPASGDVVGNFVLEQKLGRGGFAVVFRGRHRILGLTHALKILTRPTSERARNRALREARIQARLGHPNVVGVRDVIERDHRVVLVMDLVEGLSLGGWLATNRPDLATAEAIFRGVLAGVAAAHALGIVHRDLKPENILLETGSLVPRVTDFGLARLDDGESQTRTGAVMGTPAYMAPEQITDSKDVDARADMFSLGCILYELVCGERAFRGPDAGAVFEAIRDGDYPPPVGRVDHLPPRLGATIEGLLRVDRDMRIPSCAAVLEVLGPVPEAVRAVDLADAPEGVVQRAPVTTPTPEVRSSQVRSVAEAGYQVLGLIGSGGYGSVFRARYLHPSGFARDVVLKRLRDGGATELELERFRDEARVQASLTDIDDKWTEAARNIDDVNIPLEKTDITVRNLKLVWLPTAE